MKLRTYPASELLPADDRDLAAAGWRRLHAPGVKGFDAALPPLLVRPAGAGMAEARIELGVHSMNSAGWLHGGYLASMAEITLFLPLFLHGRVSSAGAMTVDFSVQFLTGGGNDVPLIASIELLKETGRMAFARGVMTQDGNRILAYSGTLRKLSVAA
ncbi:PaaI family thioesterase [Sphingosinicella soli]|uniref:Acyl-coenzyme A thioesterase PaaI-like protein n=1 Tax=Sphingosinicella soli TaxID=333708 RepID=A0A7W7F8P5_9SPHN|nr:PaaI family thioesterase [Sphingosinicella soli]MBB4633862.1 acyl-coenzyme A thioesterase PaaI-like protein [Sphingosinicella soli]